MTLRADHLSFTYSKAGRSAAPALSEVTFAPALGRVTALIGPNGSGKSTLLRLLLGSVRPTAGRVTLGGADVHRLTPRERARSIAYIAQRPDAAFAYSVREVVSLGRLALGTSASVDRLAVNRALERLDLTAVADRPLPQLSVGQQQRVAIARAIAQLDQSDNNCIQCGSRYLLADEPVAALDPRHAIQTLSTLRELAADSAAQPIGVVVVLHDLQAAARYADDALLLSGGRIAAQGPATDIITPYVLEPVFAVRFNEPAPGVLIPGSID